MPKFTVIVREMHVSSADVNAAWPLEALEKVEGGSVTWHRHHIEHKASIVKNEDGHIMLADLNDCEREKDPAERERERLDTLQQMIDESEIAEAIREREQQRIFDWLLRLAKIGEDNLNPLTIANRILNREYMEGAG